VTPDGQHLICVCPNEIWIRELRKGREWKIPERQTISSLSLSGDGQSMIVNLNSQEIHLWKTNGSSSAPDKFKGHKQGKFVIRSCFGGSDSLFIASGSEDSQVHRLHDFFFLSMHCMSFCIRRETPARRKFSKQTTNWSNKTKTNLKEAEQK
jgi:WD40 repeat protein